MIFSRDLYFLGLLVYMLCVVILTDHGCVSV